MKWKNNLALLPLVVATFASAQPMPADIGRELQVMRQQIQQLQQQLQQQQLQQQAQQPASPSLSLFPFTAQMPIGSVVAFAMTNLPEGWLACNGAAVSREQYAALFDRIHVTFGMGDGWNTFNLPDLRGEFIRGLDEEGERQLGSLQMDALQNMTGKVSFGDNINNTGNLVFGTSGVFGEENHGNVWYQDNSPQGNERMNAHTLTFDASKLARTADETRPRNVALLYAIKAF